MNWIDTEAPSLDDFETLARDAFAGLPVAFRAPVGEVVFMVQDFPDEDVVEEMQLETEFDILGLFEGPDLAGHEPAVRLPGSLTGKIEHVAGELERDISTDRCCRCRQ